jgi:hypothetical protein
MRLGPGCIGPGHQPLFFCLLLQTPVRGRRREHSVSELKRLVLDYRTGEVVARVLYRSGAA